MTPIRFDWARFALLASLAVDAGCGGTSVLDDHTGMVEDSGSLDVQPDLGGSTDAASEDASHADQSVQDAAQESEPKPDVAVWDVETDAAVDGGTCGCAPTEVWREHECVPTKDIGCASTCGSTTDCEDTWQCEPCAATQCGGDGQCFQACVQGPQSPGLVEQQLRIVPWLATAGSPQTISILGYPYYIGALWYSVFVGSNDVTHTVQNTSACTITITTPALAPGMYPILVSQYGGEAPWVLAGYLVASAGDEPGCTQPGYPCGPEGCCGTVDVPSDCVAGRCMRTGS